MRLPFPNLPELLRDAARRHGGKILAVSEEGKPKLTFAEAAARVEEVAAAFHGLGVRPGDRVALCLRSEMDEFLGAWAAMRLGAAFVCISNRASAAQIAHITADADPALLVIDGAGEAAPAGASPPLRRVRWDALSAGAPAAPPWTGGGDDLAALAYTSGSTGLPKGVMIGHGNFLEAAARVDAYLGHTPADRVPALIPLNAPWGLLQWVVMIQAGGSLVLPPAARLPAELAGCIRRTGVSGMAALSVTWIQLVDWARDSGATLPELRYVTSSGGPMPERILRALPIVFPRARICLTYGLTEAFRTTVVPPDWFARKMGSLGRPCPGVDIAVVDERGRAVPRGTRGELVHRGSCVALGYWRRGPGEEPAFRPCPAGDPAKEGRRAHYSGDLVEEDEDGFLWFAGRRDALIKTGGFRVSPEEIESAALASGLVRQAVAWGEPDDTLGEIIALAVAPSDAEGVKAALPEYLRGALPAHLRPRRLEYWAEPFPLAPSGKIDREKVRRPGEKQR